MDIVESLGYQALINEICELNWIGLTSQEMVSAAWAYYYFSIQFRENLEIARQLFPHDDRLWRLEQAECNTDNLSPWPEVAEIGERMNHDEFMRRSLTLLSIDRERTARLAAFGEAYLTEIRGCEPMARALSIATYEDGGLERVFQAILQFQQWDNAMLKSFQHFLAEHIRFDSDPEQGHGALSRHLAPDNRVLPLWLAFRNILVTCVPKLAH